MKILTKLSRLFKLLLDLKVTNKLCSFRFSGYLYDIGWFNSFRSMSSIGKDNEPIPWVTYPFIDFIKPRLKKHFEILEFGSGNGTLFYSDKVGFITAIEHDKTWYNTLSSKIPKNVKVIYKENGKGGYSNISKDLNKKMDLIIVDGIERVDCIVNSFSLLSSSGVMVLDDSEREEYSDAINFMKKNDYKQLDFWGIAPSLFYRKCTSIFYKDGNCLDI